MRILTVVFAVGNSLADLVANVTVAQFAPAMAYAACFVSTTLMRER